jgi:hypothetical protein
VIVVVVVVLVELFRVTAAVKVVVVLIGTLTEVGVIATAVTRTLPLLPHEEILTNPPIASTRAKNLEYRFLITGLPFDRSAPHRPSNPRFGIASQRSRESPAEGSY